MIVAGIDPGMTGAISIFERSELTMILDMPTYDSRVDGLELSSMLERIEYAVVENQHPMPKNGSISSFKLGMNYGVVLGVLEQMAIPFMRVPSSTWRNFNGLAGKPKEASLALARELWPKFKPMLTRQRDHNRAEAALIGRYGTYRKLIERKANDGQGDGDRGPEGDRAVRRGRRQADRAEDATPRDQRRDQAARRRGDRVAQVHALVRSDADQDNDRGGSR